MSVEIAGRPGCVGQIPAVRRGPWRAGNSIMFRLLATPFPLWSYTHHEVVIQHRITPLLRIETTVRQIPPKCRFSHHVTVFPAVVR